MQEQHKKQFINQRLLMNAFSRYLSVLLLLLPPSAAAAACHTPHQQAITIDLAYVALPHSIPFPHKSLSQFNFPWQDSPFDHAAPKTCTTVCELKGMVDKWPHLKSTCALQCGWVDDGDDQVGRWWWCAPAIKSVSAITCSLSYAVDDGDINKKCDYLDGTWQ